jgi:6-phosphogluconolactonase
MQFIIYIGTQGEGAGIQAWRLEAASGTMEKIGLAAKMGQLSFQALHPNRRFLYSVREISRGAVCAFSIDRRTGALGFINEVSSHGNEPAYVSIDRTGRNLLAANYGSGNLAVFPIHADGGLGEATDVIQHQGSSINPTRQEGPHAHSIDVSPDNHFALVADLGLDKIFVYRFDPARGKLMPNTQPFANTRPGAGPRHLVFHPNGCFVYAINELHSTMTVFAWSASAGTLRELQTISTLPSGFTGTSDAAEVCIEPGGRYLYGSNRGHDSMVVFRIDRNSGLLEPLEWVPTQGKTPRSFGIDSTGAWLLVANQASNNLVLFGIDPQNGRLRDSGVRGELASPSCVRILPSNALW